MTGFEIIAICHERGLTHHETQIVLKFLANLRMPYELKNYPRPVRMMVAEMRHRLSQPQESERKSK